MTSRAGSPPFRSGDFDGPTAVAEERDCAICSSRRKRNLFSQRFAAISEATILEGYDVVACENCGFCYADQLPPQEAFDSYYRLMSKYEHQNHAGEASEFETYQFPALASAIAEHMPDKHSRILEIGCANGGLLKSLEGIGYPYVLGVEPSPACRENAWRLYKIRVMTGTLSRLPPDLGTFDFVILVAVLEHVRDLERAMQSLRDLVSPNGHVFVEVPDVTQFAASPNPPFQEFSIEHINFFSSISLANLMMGHGFAQVHTSHVAYNRAAIHAGGALRSVFHRTSGVYPSSLVHDNDSEPRLLDYIQASRDLEARIHRVIDRLAESQEPTVVWGVGTQTQRLLAAGDLGRVNITAFVDSNPHYQGKRLNGISILSPSDMKTRGEVILVSSQTYESEIVQQIRGELGLTNAVVTLSEG